MKIGDAHAGETLAGKLKRAAARFAPTKLFVMRRPASIVTITFDDCFDSATRIGADILEDAGIHATYYAAGALCDGSFHGVPYYHAERLATLARAGHEIGSHSFSHSAFVSLSVETMRTELERNDEFLKNQVGIDEVHSFSYPFGYFDLPASLLTSRRFAACRGTRPGINGKVLDLAHLRANPIGPSSDLLNRCLASIDKVGDDGGWLILYTHDVSDTPTPFGCTPQAFRAVVAKIRAAGVDALTMRNAVGAISASS